MFYLISYASLNIKYQDSTIHKSIIDSKIVNDWWHYSPGTYIVESKYSIEKLMTEFFIEKDLPFFIIEITKTNISGLLPKVAWNWLIKHDLCNNITRKSYGKINTLEFYTGFNPRNNLT